MKLTIFDFSKNILHIYNIEKPIQEINDKYIENLGYDINKCHWTVGFIEIIEHLGTLL